MQNMRSNLSNIFIKLTFLIKLYINWFLFKTVNFWFSIQQCMLVNEYLSTNFYGTTTLLITVLTFTYYNRDV